MDTADRESEADTMRCDEFRSRLDAAGPAGLTSAHLAHARGCAACAAELQAAETVEAMLREAPPALSPEFTARVLERVEATERARRRLAESPRVSIWAGWWRAVAEEPAAIVALALAPVPLLLAALWPETAATLVVFVRDALAGWAASLAHGALSVGSGATGITDSARAIVNLVAIPSLIVLALLGFQWVGEGFGGSVTSASRAHKASTSRRNPS
jgi:hypothetical protein